MGTVYKNAGIEAARIAGRDPIMDVEARRVKGIVLGVVAGHSKTGSYASKVVVREIPGKNGVRDREVAATDRESMKIEYGHWWVTPMGVVVKWVKGIRIMNRAFDIAKKG